MLSLFCGLIVNNIDAQNENTPKRSKQLADSVASSIIQTGLRTEKGWRNTGATYTITGKELERMNVSNLLNALNGRIPGLTVKTGSGEPGYDDPSFYVRGVSSWADQSNSMLVYVDGFQVNYATVGMLMPTEVESITVLKDAVATAAYGFSGNGAILVTTKKGTNSGKTKIALNARYGVQSAIQLPSVLNAYDYTRFYNQALQNDGLPIKYANPDLYKSANDVLHPNVDWYGEMLKNCSPVQTYNLSFRGGGEKAKYFVSLDHSNFSGLYKNADEISKDFGTNAMMRKYNVRGNIELQLTPSLSVHSEVAGKIDDRITPSGFNASDFFSNLMKIPAAAFPIKDEYGRWATNRVYNFNPAELLKQGGIYQGHDRSLQVNVSFNEKLDVITKGLNLTGGISFSNNYFGTYDKHFTTYTYELLKDGNDNPILDANGKNTYVRHGSVSNSISDGENSHWNRANMQLGLNYDRTFGQHSVTAMVLAKRQTYTYNGLIYEFRTQGLASDVTYDYAKKYIVDFSASYMGSADMRDAKRYGFFPAVGAAWIASSEDFLKDNSIVDYLKVKASYGTVGALDDSYRFMDRTYSTYNGASWKFTESNSDFPGRAEGQLGNPNFSWNKKTTFNIGFEAIVLNSLSLSLDVFNEKRTGILEQPNDLVPDFSGINTPILNTGKVSNHGFEAIVKYDGKVSDFQYNVGVSAAFARNKIDYKSDPPKSYSWLNAAGYRVDQARGLQCVGFYQTADFDASGNLNSNVVKSGYDNVHPGDLKYKDQNGDGIINDFDKVPMKYATSGIPEWTFGFNLGFKYKGFDFDAFLQGVTNRTVTMPSAYTQPFGNSNNNITPFSLNAWTPATAATATSPRLSTITNLNNTQSSDFWYRDGSFVKLRSIELGYTVPKLGLFKKIETVRFYVNGTNLFTWDKINSLEAENLSMGYPLMKAVSFGVNLVF